MAADFFESVGRLSRVPENQIGETQRIGVESAHFHERLEAEQQVATSDVAAEASTAAHDRLVAMGIQQRGTGYENVVPVQARATEQKARYKEIGMSAAQLVPDAISMRVPYLNAEERAQHKLSVSDGRLMTAAGQPLDTGDHAHLVVMDKHGDIYAASSEQVVRHSGFLSGNPVAAAGLISAKNGQPEKLINESGHYRVPQDYFDQLTSELTRQGVSVPPDAIDKASVRPSSSALRKHGKALAKGRPDQTVYSESTKEPDSITTGTHKAGQTQRLYPSGPKWDWL
jgi:hypothetical protein